MFALIDCNNFFASCERVFRPDYEDRPLVVLSSNDGCAIARSNEAKALGIPMGAPVFKYRDLFKTHNVIQCSANFELYGNIARRITSILYELTPRTEVYSIDESFVDISALPIADPLAWGKAIRARILREIGVPVSIGIAPTKTLAKLASNCAKTELESGGVLVFDDINRETYLARARVIDVWGIGSKLALRLRSEGISTALQVTQMRPQHAQQMMGIHGRHLVAELSGISCLPLEQIGTIRKSIMRGRTFGEDTNKSHIVESAIASLAAQAAFRLRQDDQATMRAGLLVETNKHKPGYRRWWQEIRYITPETDTGSIIQSLTEAFARMYSQYQYYHRANIFLFDFTSASRTQTDIFGHLNSEAHDKTRARMQAIDAINNKFGHGHIKYAAENLSTAWRPKRQLCSPRYVTKWDELPIATVTPC